VACAAAALIVIPSATPQTVVGRTVVRALALPTGTAKSLSISCPAGYFALSAGASRTGAGVTALTDRPLGLRTFSLRLSNSGDADRRVTVAAACRRVRPAGKRAPYLKLATRRRVRLRVSTASLGQTHLTCPSGTVPAAAGFDAGRRDVTVREETQDLHTLSFTAYNRGTAARSISFYGSCLTVVRPAGASPAQLQVSLATDTVPIPTGSQVVTRTCPQGWLSLSVGYSVPAGLDLNGAAAVGRTGRWTLTNAAQKPLLAQVQLACARLS
jgi:hypothetical protein